MSVQQPSPARSSQVGAAGWRLDVYDAVGSTNDLARVLPAWSAVQALTQTSGRGRFGRAFVSDPGGLWISAILPAEGGAAKWAGFSLMVGCHLLRLLRAVGVQQARLRWPNDLMAQDKKLAGLLIEQDTREKLTVGFGLNVTNTPWQNDPALRLSSTRLADLVTPRPDLKALAVQVLDALADAHAEMQVGGLAAAIEELNAHWATPRPVKISLIDGDEVTGGFTGLDDEGNLRLENPGGRLFLIEHHRVERLSEI